MGCLCSRIALAREDLRNLASGDRHLITAHTEINAANGQLSQVTDLLFSGVYARNIETTTTTIARLHEPLRRKNETALIETRTAQANLSASLNNWISSDRAHHAAVAAAAAARARTAAIGR